ncbi:phosphoenolpyruvate--protein phosphotransferase [Pullulanibacillus sp. KACC 23026]|uniref:phosphoenolpyruvate--protein phosphotransferase n=1 Tax=Pullulanibacillus sp. KACC 23026 TaxID=3028315 RepID=UPI0023B08125|nr:phosphoenolpyruvate--protein phosphotransferase [Pullulanibacillus sp. KACC 23026]WEG12895.1 phosphoenolpyruvate--protein phosphotransferase [Pullulanibacillus sp. KACC 23026]
MSTKIKGIAASSGIAIAKAFLLQNASKEVEKKTISDPEKEYDRFEQAVTKAKAELQDIRDRAEREMGAENAAIFSAHLLVLEDPELLSNVKTKIDSEKVNAEFALKEVAAMFISIFEQMDNDYMKERAADIRDVSERVIAHLMGVTLHSPASIQEEVIVLAEDLTPSDTAQLNRQYVKGFATNIGGRTSHSAIMSRSMEIPAVVGTKKVTAEIENGTLVIIDGIEGLVIGNPTDEQIQAYKQKKEAFDANKKEWAKLKDQKTVTSDQHHVELAANIGTPKDLQGVRENGAEAIGLYRTEFLYMDRDKLPTEDEQFAAYKEVLEGMEGKPVVIRTLDIGGDKELPYLNLPKEMNPFLGYRAIRLCLDQQDIFRTQLRALLRASVYGNLKVMFPMIATLTEFREAKEILLEEKRKLQEADTPVSDTIEIGMMVEIPSTAVSADLFAKEVDFFSIGTNDLIQYTMAADRMNEQVSYLYQPFNPSILRLIKLVTDAAHKEGKWVGMCGEMAGDPLAVPVLLAIGLDELSMSASSILPARTQLLSLSKEEADKHVETLLNMDTADDVVKYTKETFKLA